MFFYGYCSHNGGTNNVSVATDGATGIFATSVKGWPAAERNLKRKLRRRAGRGETVK